MSNDQGPRNDQYSNHKLRTWLRPHSGYFALPVDEKRQVFCAYLRLFALNCAYFWNIFSKSLFGNYERACGWGFWLWRRRRGASAQAPSIPKAGCKERANAGHSQKTRRPEGFRAKGRLALLLLSRRPTRGIPLRRALPSGLWRENRPARSFQSGSKKNGSITGQS